MTRVDGDIKLIPVYQDEKGMKEFGSQRKMLEQVALKQGIKIRPLFGNGCVGIGWIPEE